MTHSLNKHALDTVSLAFLDHLARGLDAVVVVDGDVAAMRGKSCGYKCSKTAAYVEPNMECQSSNHFGVAFGCEMGLFSKAVSGDGVGFGERYYCFATISCTYGMRTRSRNTDGCIHVKEGMKADRLTQIRLLRGHFGPSDHKASCMRVHLCVII